VARQVSKEHSTRERLLDAAYYLFSRQGVNRVGIDTILERSGCAKASLYAHFESKLDLAIAFLERRDELWTRGWLEAGIKQRSSDPTEQLMVVFDLLDGWFARLDFEGCPFTHVLLETDPDSPLHQAALTHLAKVRTIISGVARDAGLREPETFAQIWHMLMKGAILAACEGNKAAAREAQRAAELVIAGWPKHRPADDDHPSPLRTMNDGQGAPG
jgi:AcrR family transcriptional regulator